MSPWFSLPENLILPYKQNHVTFVYKALYYRAQKKIKYKYILEGLDKKWSPATSVNEAVYAGLSPGDYTFKVIACNENEEWNEIPATYNISIKPPFWQTLWFYSICFIAAVIAFIVYIRIRERNLRNEKIRLEGLVKQRTKEVVEQKDEIEKQRDKIKQQHDIVSKQKDEITESIQYASKIQSAVISSDEILQEEFSDYFVLYLPRDIVSGDFYWFGKNNSKIIICAADCTGHGVPGALTSMLGISLLNEAVRLNTLISPDEILNALRSNIISSFKQTSDEEGKPKDGMDMAVIVYDKQKEYLEYAGAYNPILIVRKKEQHQKKNTTKQQEEYIEIETEDYTLYELPANRMPVAIYTTMEPFRKIRFNMKKGDTIYCFSDGYFDQFGGENHRKFSKKRFKELILAIQNYNLAKQGELLRTKYEDWRIEGSDFQVDDIMVIGLKI